MNANELADELDIHVSMVGGKFFTECATMLRQQQTEIDSLKDKLNLANKSLEIIEGWTK